MFAGTAIDQGIACILMLVALVLTYLNHWFKDQRLMILDVVLLWRSSVLSHFITANLGVENVTNLAMVMNIHTIISFDHFFFIIIYRIKIIDIHIIFNYLLFYINNKNNIYIRSGLIIFLSQNIIINQKNSFIQINLSSFS
jgi:hypothetical protein